MAGAGKKTFTAGETLTASDVNTYLMEQSVMVFGGTAARSSAIPTPSEGMTSYRTDTQQIESYDGAEWRGMSGLQLVKKQTVGTTVSSVTVTGAFSAIYENYKIIYTGGAQSAAQGFNLQLGATTTGYNSGLIYILYSNAAVVGIPQSNGGSFAFAGYGDTTSSFVEAELYQPFLNKYTYYASNHIQPVGQGAIGRVQGMQNSTTSFTEFTLLPQGGVTLTGGTIYVYGYGT